MDVTNSALVDPIDTPDRRDIELSNKHTMAENGIPAVSNSLRWIWNARKKLIHQQTSGLTFTKNIHAKAEGRTDPANNQVDHPFVVCVTGAGKGCMSRPSFTFTISIQVAFRVWHHDIRPTRTDPTSLIN